MKNHTEEAKKLITDNIYLTIATASKSGKPWISPMFFAYDQNYHFFWVSNKDSLHSQLIRSNPAVALVIFDSQAPEGLGDGVYFEATAQELIDESDIKHATTTLNARITKDEFKIKKASAVTGNGMWRLYQAVPTKVYKLTEGKFINGQYIDTKVEIQL